MKKAVKNDIMNGMKIQEIRIGQKIQDEYGKTYRVRNIIDTDYVKTETGEVLSIHNIRPDPSEPYILVGDDNKLKLVVSHDEYLFTACGETLEEVGYDVIWVSIANREQTASVDVACHQAEKDCSWMHTQCYQDGLLTGCEDPDTEVSISMRDIIQEKMALDGVEKKIEGRRKEYGRCLLSVHIAATRWKFQMYSKIWSLLYSISRRNTKWFHMEFSNYTGTGQTHLRCHSKSI